MTEVLGVGDRVRILSNRPYFTPLLREEVCTVVSVGASRVVIERDSDNTQWSLRDNGFGSVFVKDNDSAPRIPISDMIGKNVMVLFDHANDSSWAKGHIGTVTHVDSSQYICLDGDTGGGWLHYNKRGVEWELIDFSELKELEIGFSMEKNKFSFAFNITKEVLKSHLIKAGYGLVDDDKIDKIMKALDNDRQEFERELSDFLFDEQFGFVHQTIVQECGEPNVSGVERYDAGQDYVDDDVDDEF